MGNPIAAVARKIHFPGFGKPMPEDFQSAVSTQVGLSIKKHGNRVTISGVAGEELNKSFVGLTVQIQGQTIQLGTRVREDAATAASELAAKINAAGFRAQANGNSVVCYGAFTVNG